MSLLYSIVLRNSFLFCSLFYKPIILYNEFIHRKQASKRSSCLSNLDLCSSFLKMQVIWPCFQRLQCHNCQLICGELSQCLATAFKLPIQHWHILRALLYVVTSLLTILFTWRLNISLTTVLSTFFTSFYYYLPSKGQVCVAMETGGFLWLGYVTYGQVVFGASFTFVHFSYDVQFSCYCHIFLFSHSYFMHCAE